MYRTFTSAPTWEPWRQDTSSSSISTKVHLVVSKLPTEMGCIIVPSFDEVKCSSGIVRKEGWDVMYFIKTDYLFQEWIILNMVLVILISLFIVETCGLWLYLLIWFLLNFQWRKCPIKAWYSLLFVKNPWWLTKRPYFALSLEYLEEGNLIAKIVSFRCEIMGIVIFGQFLAKN